MDRVELCREKMEELFGGKPVTTEGNDPEFMRILQRFIFGEVCYLGSLDNKMREPDTATAGFPHGSLSPCGGDADRDPGSHLSVRAFYRISKDIERHRYHRSGF